MQCLYCRQPISTLRSLQDPQFCCAAHSEEYKKPFGRVIKRSEAGVSLEDRWDSYAGSRKLPKDRDFRGLILVAFGMLVLTLVTMVWPRGSTNEAQKVQTPRDLGLSLASNWLRAGEAVSVRQDFHADKPLSSWTRTGPGPDWVQLPNGGIHPAGLRIWEPSTSMSDYELEFSGRIEKKSMDWAFRAVDSRNYYAAKLQLPTRGLEDKAELVRYVVLDGHSMERSQLPLPVHLAKGADYRVHVSVRGSRFLTSVDGQLVSSWADTRISRGGIGFFTEDGEASLVNWVTLSERDSLVGRLLARFSLILLPPSAIR